MAFTVETGSGDPNANSLTSVEFFVSYCTDRGYTIPAAWDTTRIQVNLVKATDYINQRYFRRFTGVPTTDVQACCWPRRNATRQVSSQDNSGFYQDGFGSMGGVFVPDNSLRYIGSSEIPMPVQQSACELALIADKAGDLSPVIARDDVNVIAKKIGPIEIDYNRRHLQAWDIFPKVTRLLGPYFSTGGNQIPMVRG